MSPPGPPGSGESGSAHSAHRTGRVRTPADAAVEALRSTVGDSAAASGPSDASSRVGTSGRVGSSGRSDASRQGGTAPTVTSLSVDELVMLHGAGYQPSGLVSGASAWRFAALGTWTAGLNENAEVPTLSRSMNGARSEAIAHLAAAAAAIGADGVVGVQIKGGDPGDEHGRHLVHFLALGTAVTSADGAVRAAGVAKRPPFTSGLSGQELVLLLRAGWRPISIVTGSCAYHIGRRSIDNWAKSVKVNQEMATYTTALYQARELAMGRLQANALSVNADGVVGVTVSERARSYRNQIIEFTAIGTAVVLDGEAHRPLHPRMVVDLS